MEAGFNENTLAVFTACAPCGTICFLLLTLHLVVHPNAGVDTRSRFDKLVFVPVAVVWVGFIASATHLGTPANALYVVNGVGRSPLSNEVVATVAFLFFAGVYWLYTFRIGYSRILAGLLLLCACISAMASVGFMSVAYNVATVPSWDTPYSALSLVLTGVFSGASLAVCVLRHAHHADCAWTRLFVVLSAAALAVSTGVMMMQVDWLAGVANNVTSALDEAPAYGMAVYSHAVVGGLGLLVQMLGLLRQFASWRRACFFCWMGFALVLAAALLVRFPFYDSYLSLGF